MSLPREVSAMGTLWAGGWELAELPSRCFDKPWSSLVAQQVKDPVFVTAVAQVTKNNIKHTSLESLLSSS